MEKKTERIEIRVTKEFKKKFKDKCEKLGVPMSTYLLSQLAEPDWVSKIKVREGRPPAKSIWRPPRPPMSVLKKRKEDGIIPTLDKSNMILELKKVLFNGVDEFFKPYEHTAPVDLEEKARLASQRMIREEEEEE